MSKTMLKVQKDFKKEDLEHILKNESKVSIEEATVASQEFKTSRLNLQSINSKNQILNREFERIITPVKAFDRIYTTKNKEIDKFLSTPASSQVELLTKLRKEHFKATLKHNFSITGNSFDLK